ncbi:uncharacterized protein [Solanum lycopersicum]|uniref:uncharacterized protein isoform X2 n=1 Tax=Solanum lycopersicum TaxID=4081 RepID=UPI0037485CC4
MLLKSSLKRILRSLHRIRCTRMLDSKTLLSSKAFPDFLIKCEDRNLELLLLQSQRYSVILFCNMVGNTILSRWRTLLVLIAWTLLHCYKKLTGAF